MILSATKAWFPSSEIICDNTYSNKSSPFACPDILPPAPPSTTPTPWLCHFITHILCHTHLHPSAALYLLQCLMACSPWTTFLLVPTSHLLHHLSSPQPHSWITLLLTPSIVPVMTTHNYDLDTFSFLLSSLTLTTPVSLISLYYHLLHCSLVPFLSLPLYSYHSLTHTAWPMTHSDDSGCTTSLFSYLLGLSIWLIVMHFAYTYLL